MQMSSKSLSFIGACVSVLTLPSAMAHDAEVSQSKLTMTEDLNIYIHRYSPIPICSNPSDFWMAKLLRSQLGSASVAECVQVCILR